jgi:glycosyltransferase involved in cell wall biosynthesis
MTGRRDEIAFLVTHGTSSLDFYAEKLAEQLPVRQIHSVAYQNGATLFGSALTSRRGLRALVGEAALARRLRAEGVALHLPNHHCGRYGLRLETPYVITVHDLMRMADCASAAPLIGVPSPTERVLLRLDARGIRKAAGIIAVSEATKRDLVRSLAIPEERIAVVHEGIDHQHFRPVRERPIEFRYILFVGSEQPRKNLPTLLRALALLKREGRLFRDLKLVKVGGAGENGHPFRTSTERVIRELGLENDVLFTGRVPEEELPAYYSAAECLVLPSLYEGFGLPPLEAMACGCPVIASDRGALPETAGPGGILVDPSDEVRLAATLKWILTDDSARQDLRVRGLDHAAGFSWERCARQTLHAYARFL